MRMLELVSAQSTNDWIEMNHGYGPVFVGDLDRPAGLTGFGTFLVVWMYLDFQEFGQIL